MTINDEYVHNLNLKNDKEKAMKEKYIQKRKELDAKIKKCDDNIKKNNEEIENLQIDKTIKAIKLKGYSLSYIQEIIESGVLDHNKENSIKEDENC